MLGLHCYRMLRDDFRANDGERCGTILSHRRIQQLQADGTDETLQERLEAFLNGDDELIRCRTDSPIVRSLVSTYDQLLPEGLNPKP